MPISAMQQSPTGLGRTAITLALSTAPIIVLIGIAIPKKLLFFHDLPQ
ncbi:UNVERIFIED_CONTAM: hypothetical protein LBW93_03400 [Wolbachia endosymbiont of Nasonia longicornis]